MRSTSPLRIIIAIGILLLFSASLFIRDSRGSLMGRASHALGLYVSSPLRIFTATSLPTTEELIAENRRLHAEVSLLSHTLSKKEQGVYEAHVFSSYPFNHRGLIEIDAGSGEGIREGMGVAASGLFLLGRIETVSPHTSIVKTIFDNDVSLPVKIGKQGIDALLVGGRTPRLTLIVKDAEIAPGDQVYSTGAHFPYGLAVGELLKIHSDSGGAFREASIMLPYDPGSLEMVSVFTL